jgi:hypothetical protein
MAAISAAADWVSSMAKEGESEIVPGSAQPAATLVRARNGRNRFIGDPVLSWVGPEVQPAVTGRLSVMALKPIKVDGEAEACKVSVDGRGHGPGLSEMGGG